MKLLAKITDSDFKLKKKKCVFKKRRATRGLLFNKGKVALMYIGSMDCYSLPGGGIEKGETIKEGLIREMKEETGCVVEIVKELGKTQEKRTQHLGHGLDQTSYGYLTKLIKKGKPKFTKEEIGSKTKLKWISIKKVVSVIKEKPTKDYSSKFINKRTLIFVEKFLK